MSQRPYPSSEESERALLGGLILDPSRIDEAAHRVKPEDFFREDHGRLFQLLLDLRAQQQAIDLVSISEWVQRDDKAGAYGGVAYVVSLTREVPATANLAHYAGVVREKAVLRRLIERTEHFAERAYAQPASVSTLISEAARDIQELAADGDQKGWSAISSIIDDEIVAIEERGQKDSDVAGIPTGFLDLDAKLAGLHPTDLIVLAARPAMGKTALALNLAQNAALRGGVGVGIFSLEMGRGQLVSRMLCTLGEVDASRVRKGRLDPDDWDRMNAASDELRKLHVYIDDTGNLSIGELRARALSLAAKAPNLGLIVIDYLQLMKGDPRITSREQQISSISRGLKALAKDLNVPVIALSQLNRGVESRQNKRPLVSDLRESGAIEQDADLILFIYRDEYYNEDSPEPGVAEVIIAKHRAGPTGTVKLAFQGQFTRFDNLADPSVIALD
ncbi:MAG: replicative DNA helicase [Deltaproteobacteria bacterium]|nr:MAG: replicative DNA helicase [Deltaproteobacteria bacterium]